MDSLIREIRASIAARENQTALYEETNFRARAEALDFLEMANDRIECLLLTADGCESLAGLKAYAESLKNRLEGIDEQLFRRLRQEIASGRLSGTAWKQRIVENAGASRGSPAEEGYDALDTLVNGILLAEAAPENPSQREPEMIFYQPTPARIVLEMVERINFRPDDLFYDIGSGLGQVAILVHLLAGVRSKGVEIDPAFCAYAQRCARGLNLPLVEFVHSDARTADYADGSVFFLYTPVIGTILEQVLERLRHVSTQREIRLCTFGPCTPQVARQRWLQPLDQNGGQANRLALFSSGERAQMRIALAQERADSPDAQALVVELDSFLTPLYSDEDHHGYSVEKLIAQGVAFFVLRYDGAAAACGGVQLFGPESEEGAGEAFGEIKRMYVRPAFRGRGLAKAMLAHLEAYTRSQGVDLLRLETGIYQTEAIGLYEGNGYTRTGPFGPYEEGPFSLLYEKRLA